MRDHIYASNAQVRGTGLLQRNIMDCQPGFLIGSLNPLVAAYFAVAEPHAGNSAVYAYDIGRPLRLDENPDPFTLVSIARFTPPHISERITAQSGLFTVHPSERPHLIGVFGASGKHGVDQAREFVGGGLSQTGYRFSGGMPPSRFTNVDDVTQDHANPRALRTIAKSVFRGTAFHCATPQVSSARFARSLQATRSCVLRRPAARHR